MKQIMIKLLLVTWTTSILAASGHSQETDFFWSLQDLNSGAVNRPLVISAQPGDAFSLYLYYTTNGPSDQGITVGAMLDLAPSQDGVIRFTGAESFNYSITIADIEIGGRWFNGNDCGGAAGMIGSVTDSLINEWGALGLFGEGMTDATAGNPFTDAGYDSAADAFLFGRIDIEVIGDLGQCVQIQAGRGRGGIVYGQGNDAQFFQPEFGSALISIGSLLLGDVNEDGEVGLTDIPDFVLLLMDQQYAAEADINCDATLDLLDVTPFVNLLSGDGLTVEDPTSDDVKPQKNLLGDVNADGVIDLLDLACFMAFVVDCADLQNADINQDGIVNLMDACPLVKLFLSIE